MKAVDRLGPYLLGAVVGCLVLFSTAWPESHVPYPEVIVPAARIIEREPDTVRTFVDRIRFVRAAPVVVAIAPAGAMSEVAAFCRPSILAVTDTVEVEVPARVLLRSVTHRPGWWFQADRLELTGPTSLGDLKAFDYRVRPGFTARTSGDSVLVRYPRTGLFREVVEVAVPLLLGWTVARIGG